jgi:hypothetical protein
MKVGDLVMFSLAGMPQNQTGIILSFDDEDDPVIWVSPAGAWAAYQYTPTHSEYRNAVKVISERR